MANKRLTEDERAEFAESVFSARSLVRLSSDRAIKDGSDLDVYNALLDAERHLNTICTLMDKAGIS